jgi:D-glycero-alpha-D-manno-heptose 1-phosphate guanylyltransferase
MPEMPDVIVLCGGAGTRLKSVTGNTPKPMARVAGRPFAELLLRQLARHDFHRVILAVGYQSDVIRRHFGDQVFGLHLDYSTEPAPLGTGGALGNAAGIIQSDLALVMNGDSYTNVNLAKCVLEHQASKADVSVVVVRHNERSDCGAVSIDDSGRIEWFRERYLSSGIRYINAGVYVISTSLLSSIPSRTAISLEKELLPRWLTQGLHLRAFVSSADCVDIGTPDRYYRAQRILANS